MPKEELDELSFWHSASSFRSITLEGQAQPETDQTAVVDALLIEARVNSSKVFIARNVCDWEESACSFVRVETKAA